MAEPPGSIGWPVLGDQSMDFISDPVGFVEGSIKQYESRVFAGRVMNKATVFVCSNLGVRQVLSDDTGAFEMGYQTCMEQVYPQNILYTNGEEASILRDRIGQLFTEEALQSYRETIDRKPLGLYHFFKKVVSEISLTLSLGLDFSSEAAEAGRVLEKTLRHWHGLISVPVNLRVPGTCYESSYCRAMMAKKDLMEVIRNQRGKVRDGFVPRLQQEASEEDEEFINNHLLLFSSALVPKAIASLLTTFAIEMGRPKMASLQAELVKNEELMKNVLREVQRLCPPFVGGRRLTTKNVVVDGYRIPADYAVVYVTQAAHRDPAVFPDPDVFRPQRWAADKGLSDANLFVFGLGPRNCLGEQLAYDILSTVATQLLSHYHWVLPEDQNTGLKHMPVSRPRHPIRVDLQPVSSNSDHEIVNISSDMSSSSDTSYSS